MAQTLSIAEYYASRPTVGRGAETGTQYDYAALLQGAMATPVRLVRGEEGEGDFTQKVETFLSALRKARKDSSLVGKVEFGADINSPETAIVVGPPRSMRDQLLGTQADA